MDNGEFLAVGLPVQKLVGAVYGLDSDHAIIPHPPMVVQTVQEEQTVAINVTPLHVQLVRMEKFLYDFDWVDLLFSGRWLGCLVRFFIMLCHLWGGPADQTAGV